MPRTFPYNGRFFPPGRPRKACLELATLSFFKAVISFFSYIPGWTKTTTAASPKRSSSKAVSKMTSYPRCWLPMSPRRRSIHSAACCVEAKKCHPVTPCWRRCSHCLLITISRTSVEVFFNNISVEKNPPKEEFFFRGLLSASWSLSSAPREKNERDKQCTV